VFGEWVLSQSHWREIFDPEAQIFLNSVVIFRLY
jgi:hypothetical protein